MIYQASTLALLLTSQVLASPIYPFAKRQDPVASTISVVSDTAVVPVSTQTFSAPGAEPTGQPADEPEEGPTDTPEYPCPEGFLLTYVEEERTYQNIPIAVLRQFVGDFQNASYFGYLNGTGGNEEGATRYLVSGHEEVLIEQFNDIPDTNILTQTVFNLTNGPIEVGNGTTLSTYQTVLQVIRNVTASGEDDGDDDNDVGTVKIFSNFCASDQAAGAAAQREAFRGALENLEVVASGGTLDQDNFPQVTATVQTTFTIAAPTVTFSSTAVADAPTETVVDTATAPAPTETVSETITPEVVPDVVSNTATPEPVTETAVDTVTPEPSTAVVPTTVTPEPNTATAVTTINPLTTS